MALTYLLTHLLLLTETLAGQSTGSAEQLNDKYKDLAPQLAQIDEMDAQVGELESAVAQLDSYSRRLEAKFMSLESGP